MIPAHADAENEARSDTGAKPHPSPPLWRVVAIVLGLLIATGIYLAGARLAAERVNTDSARGNQMAYLQYAYKLWDSDWEYKLERNRMPALPMLLAVTYKEGWDLKKDFFPRAKTLCIALSLVCLIVTGCAACWSLGWQPGLLLTLVLAFTLYIFRAAYVQAEVLYYTSSGLAFIGSLTLLRRPDWRLALGLGVLMGLTHLVKASILPAVALTVVLLVGKQVLTWWRQHRRDSRGYGLGKLAPMLLPALLVPIAFLLTISPYLINSKRIYGHAFYNVNSTFYMWQNSFAESKVFSSKYFDRRAYPAAPPEEIPSARRYFTTTPPGKVWERLAKGMEEQRTNLMTRYGAAKYLGLLLALGVILSWPVRQSWLPGLAAHAWELLFAVGFLMGYFLLISFYSAIANGPRFIFTLYLPVLFLLFYWVWQLPEWRPPVLVKLAVLPRYVGIRAISVGVILLLLAWDTWQNFHEVLPKSYTGT